ncbi:MAG: signal peptidase II, partial [Acidobacteriota bacterium]|nr:signal peptidase II [Acidobacteriota bacterium]
MHRLTVLAISATVFALDRWSKWLIETRFTAFDTKPIIPGLFSIVRSENPGVAFGLLSEGT